MRFRRYIKYIILEDGSVRVKFLSVAVMSLLFLSPQLAAAQNEDKQVIIHRDQFGVPHVYANDTYRLFYGYGYSVAQDRLFQMEMAKRSTQGTVSEVLGSDFIQFDIDTRNNYWPESIHKQIESLPKKDRDILKGYADGMNAWIHQVNQNTAEWLPKEFIDYDFQPSQWSEFDVAMIMVGTMANRFSDMNSELDNLALLTALKDQYGQDGGLLVFNQLKWKSNPKAPTTISEQEFSYSDNDVQTHKSNQSHYEYREMAPMFDRIAKDSSGKLLALSQEDNRALIKEQYIASGANGLAGYPTTSNVWLVGKKKAKDANSIMLNGPQFGWFNPAYTYGIGLHGAGFDVVGNTPFAYPAILFGHNGQIAWGSTAGFGDGVDIFIETVNPKDATQYQHNGEWKKMQVREEVINVKDGPSVNHKVYRTVHGNVVKFNEDKTTAYTKARAWDGKEISSLMTWVYHTQAKNWDEFLDRAQHHALTINWYYSDQDGNIGYVHTGHYPKRKEGHDSRLPISGTGEWDWDGMQSFANNPKVYNPESGYIANWNNSPAKGYVASDLFAFLWGTADRVEEINELIEAQGQLDDQAMWEILKQTSRVDLNHRFFTPYIISATKDLPDESPARQLATILEGWSGFNAMAEDDQSYISPQSAILDLWLKEMLRNTVGKVVPEPYNVWYMSSGYETTQEGPTGSLNISTGAKILYEGLLADQSGVTQSVDIFQQQSHDEVIIDALNKTYDLLVEKYGDNPELWKTPATSLTFRANNFFGIPQAAKVNSFHQNEYHNRGTENDLIVFKENGVEGWDVVAPGQSGFISQSGERSPHYNDQLELYTSFGKKPLWHSENEVKENVETTEILMVDAIE